MRLARLLLVLLISVLGGCASSTPQTIPFAKSYLGKVRTTAAVISTPEGAFKFDFTRSNIAAFAGGGVLPYLIDALINSSRENAANTLADPARTGLGTYIFEEEFRKALQAEMSKVKWFEFKDVRISHETVDTDPRKLVNGSDADALMVISASAVFSESFDTFSVRSSMDVLPRTVNPRPGADADFMVNTPIYRDKSEHVVKAPGAGADKAQNVAIWAREDSKLLRQALDDGIRKIAADLALHLSEAPNWAE